MGWKHQAGCCCAGQSGGGGVLIPGGDLCTLCDPATTPNRELLLTVPAGTFTWSGSCVCDDELEGEFILTYSASLGLPCSWRIIGLCAGHTYTAALVDVGGHGVLFLDINTILNADVALWSIDLGPLPLNCIEELSTPRTLTLVTSTHPTCPAAPDSTVTLVDTYAL